MTHSPITSNDTHGDTLVRDRIERPKMWKVLLHNDDTTPVGFVVEILMRVFNKTMDQAELLTWRIHNEGIGIAGVYTKEIAEMKTTTTVKTAKACGFPLLATMEQE